MKKTKKTLEATPIGISDVKKELTDKEIEYIILLYDENTDVEIAEKMNVSKHTAKSHRKNIMEKLGVKKSIGIVIFAIENGICGRKYK